MFRRWRVRKARVHDLIIRSFMDMIYCFPFTPLCSKTSLITEGTPFPHKKQEKIDFMASDHNSDTFHNFFTVNIPLASWFSFHLVPFVGRRVTGSRWRIVTKNRHWLPPFFQKHFSFLTARHFSISLLSLLNALHKKRLLHDECSEDNSSPTIFRVATQQKTHSRLYQTSSRHRPFALSLEIRNIITFPPQMWSSCIETFFYPSARDLPLSRHSSLSPLHI